MYQRRRGQALLAGLLLLCSCAGLGITPSARKSFQEGVGLFNRGEYEQAIGLFEKATELDPEYGEAYLYLGRSYLNLNRWIDALPPLRTAFRLAPGESKKEVVNLLIDALLGAALSESGKGNFSGAMDLFREGLKLEPESAGARQSLLSSLIALGSQSLSRGEPGEAAVWFSEAVTLAPGDIDAYIGLARAFFQKGDTEKALDAVKGAARIDPANPSAQSLFWELMKR